MKKHEIVLQRKAAKRAMAMFLAFCLVVPGIAVSGKKVRAEETMGTATLSTSQMDVLLDKEFPRVIQYTMKGEDVNDNVFYGQEKKLTNILINGKSVKPTITSEISGNKAVYSLTCKDDSNGIDAVITAEITVKDNTLTFAITNIQDNKIVKTIEIPNHSLISVRSTEKDAVLDAVNMSVNTHINGDRKVIVDDKMDINAEDTKGYMYAILSDDSLSASIFTNAESNLADKTDYSSYASKTDAQRIIANSNYKDGYKEIGLSSNEWTYQKDEGYRKEDGTLELEGKTLKLEDEMPVAKVVITKDANGDKKVDWQDGAIAFRDIMNVPLGSEMVPNLVAYRISMNFGGQAQNPFLTVLDGVKKINLNTEGLGQSILLKGYGSEGHDSGHLNYADIGQRIGGAEDMKTLLKKGKEYGATFGVHVNASETYPESKYFEEPRLLKNADGTYKYGWNWIDQGININADYDLRNGRAQRFKDFYDALGGSKNDLDFIYVDVWGNRQSGDNGTWASRQLSKEINGLDWRVASEWGYANEYNSTFQHWAADLTYGGYTLKGINSTITRFIRNHQKDSWIGDYPKYGGEADSPLLGGYSMKDFEGWQGRSDYAAYINNLFRVNLPVKFSQHYQVMEWEDGTPVQMTDNNSTYDFVPGMKAVLKDEAGKNTLTITRKSNDYQGNVDAYRTRTMTLNSKKVFEGQPNSEKYLIPWNWDSNGKKVASKNEKLYHWNTKGGTSTWSVPAGFTGSVKVYELTELGKKKVKTVPVKDGKITLTAKASTPYVVYKTAVKNKDVKWSEGTHLTDVGFNSGSLKNWTIKGDSKAASIKKSEGNNDMLAITNNKKKVTLTQKVTGLKPNTEYVAYVGVDNRSKAKAGIAVKAGSKSVSNFTKTSIAKNYVRAYAHNTLGTQKAKEDGQMTSTVNGTSYFQNMLVHFKTDKNAQATITLSKEAGTGTSYFDDIRIVENKANNFVSDTKFVQDFENVAQGIYPFVISKIEGVEDNRTHLSEFNAPYTQRGWNGRIISDVIDGKWAVKTNGLTEGNILVYQTIPQNFYFKPGVTYNVSFDYETGSDDIYAVVTGNAPFEQGEKEVIDTSTPLKSTEKEVKSGKHSFTITGDASGQTWFGIFSTEKAADLRGQNSSQANFNGYQDFVLDNLVIEVAK